MKSDGDEGLAATQLAPPRPTDATQISEPGRPTPPGPPADAPSPTAPVRNRERYQFLSEHGRGGLGRVSRAHDRDLGRDIAIKELISRDQVSEPRFLREALITARLEHPGIVPIYEAGRWPDGTPFYAMKLVAGRSLRLLLAERKTFDERIRLLHHVIAVADAIAYAHGKHIVHRDLKPANVIVGDFGETVVIDWGLAKDLTQAEESAAGAGPRHASGDAELTSVGTVLGTPAYMPPEQERGEPVDQRADVFAIGAMLWELCTLQKLPHSSSSQRRRILRRAGIDQDLIAIIDKAVDPDRALRYPDAGALAADLKAFKAGARIAARRYSLPAMLAHWTRRHRTLALSAAAAGAIAIASSVLYVHTISVERDRAEAARQTAQRDLDRAQLAEASLLLEKDPTSAKALLASLTHSPQYALLLSRANQAAATRVIQLPGRPQKLLHRPDTSEIAIVTTEGVLESVDIDSGQLRVLDHDLPGPATSQRAGWLYARRPSKASGVTVTSTTGPVRALPAGTLLTEITTELVAAGSRIYALDKHDLYTLTEDGPVLYARGVRSIAANDHLLMVCTTAGELEVTRDGASERHTRCLTNESVQPMAVAGGSYAALVDADHLLLVRDGKAQELALSTHIAGGYELALAPGGLLALADLGDKTWFVRPDGNQLELGPAHASLPTAVATDDRFAAWGYADGAVVAIDTKTGAAWTFKGHTTRVIRLAVDPGHARVISIAGTELRVWTLAPSPLREIPHVPCTVYTLAVSPDGTRAALDGYDGALRVWSLATGTVRELHHHTSVAFGVAWWGDHACSGGLDGQVLCTSPDGATQKVLSSNAQLGWLTSSPDHRALVVAANDGKIMEFDGKPRSLYIHDAAPYRMVFSADGQWLASGAEDGSVIVYDVAHRQIDCTVNAHTARVTSIVWRGDELWTASFDGTMARWRHHDHALALVDRIHEAGAFRFLHLLKNGWCGNVDSRILLVSLTAPPRVLRFDLGRHVEQFDVSPDERYIAATVAGEVVVVDLSRDTISSLSIASDGIGDVAFVTPGLLAISTTNGLFSVQPSALAHIGF